jgi:hypothetical protein
MLRKREKRNEITRRRFMVKTNTNLEDLKALRIPTVVFFIMPYMWKPRFRRYVLFPIFEVNMDGLRMTYYIGKRKWKSLRNTRERDGIELYHYVKKQTTCSFDIFVFNRNTSSYHIQNIAVCFHT